MGALILSAADVREIDGEPLTPEEGVMMLMRVMAPDLYENLDPDAAKRALEIMEGMQ